MEEKKNAIKLLLSHVGKDFSKKELELISERMLNGYSNILRGYNSDFQKIIKNSFSNSENNEIIAFDKIDFFSMCEHHFIPFFGEIQIAYIPNKKAIGFSTILEIVESITRRLQLQERIARQIAETIQSSYLEPLGVFTSISAYHFCVLSKEKKGSKPSLVKNLFTTGDFKKESNLQKLNLIV
jgi:GTP cyclohydrolase I